MGKLGWICLWAFIASLAAIATLAWMSGWLVTPNAPQVEGGGA